MTDPVMKPWEKRAAAKTGGSKPWEKRAAAKATGQSPEMAAGMASLSDMSRNPAVRSGGVNTQLGLTGRRADAVGAEPYSTPYEPGVMGTLEDMAKAGAAGVARGVTGIAGLPGTAWDMNAATLEYLGKKSGLAGDDFSIPRSPTSSEALTSAMGEATGGATDYRGKTTAGEYAGTVGEFLPGSVMGPGGIASKVIRQGIIPAVASEAAGQMAEGTAAEPYARLAGAVVGGVAASPRIAAQPAVTTAKFTPPAPKSATELGELTKKVVSGGMGSVKATEELAAEAMINPAAKAAADRLGIELPADVFSDSETMLAAIGLTRSQAASAAEGAWRNAVKSARDKADEIMAAMDGSPDIASVSEDVKSALSGTIKRLKDQAGHLYDIVDTRMGKGVKIKPDNMTKLLNETIQEMGGLEGLTPQEKSLFQLVTSPNQEITYGRLLREKSLIGKALSKGDSPYSSMDDRTLKRIYGAMAQDQLDAVSAVGAGRSELRQANLLTAKQKGLEKRIVAAFGSDLDGSIAAKLRSAVTTASKGDIAGMQKILKVIPDDLKKTAMATAISSATRSARATEPGFGLTEFSKMFAGIKANRPVMNLIGKTLGGDAMQMMDDLATVSSRIAKADSNVLRTGKANQGTEFRMALEADGLVGRVLHSTAGQRVTQAAAVGAGTAVGGPILGMVSAPLATALTSAKPEMLAKAGKLFASDEFQRLAVEAANGNASKAAIDAVNRSAPFREWAKKTGIADISSMMSNAKGPAAIVPGVSAAATVDYEPLWQRYGK